MKMLPMGYQALADKFALNVIPHYRKSFIKSHGQPTTKVNNNYEIHEYSKNYAVENPEDPFSQLEFALKYDGINLEILGTLFRKFDEQRFCQWISNRPTSKYTRISWYLYEMLTGKTLALADCKSIKYVDLLNPKKYFTCKSKKSSRHAVNDNLLGNFNFCPMVRRTNILENYIAKKLDQKAEKIIQRYDPHLIARANNYLLAKETMSSYEIERERPNKQRMAKFINLLQKAETIEHLNKEILIECQNAIVDYRFIDLDYRGNQNYVGENINQYLQKIHFISPQPNDLPDLMEGLIESLERMIESDCHPVIIATAISFGFVFFHPFEDGNGRLHRFLIHYILSRQKFTPSGLTFPISVIILQNIRDYDSILESFSKPLMEEITNYQLDNDGLLTVNQKTKHYYQYIDFTNITEYLFDCIEETIELHFARELDFLANYDKTKYTIQSIVDMPDKIIDLLIRILTQNNGKLSNKKREKYFTFLTDSELSQIIEVVIENMISNQNSNNKVKDDKAK